MSFTKETTLAALYRLAEQKPLPPSELGVLNFASAKNPGGGFLGGAQAQEESLARSSALYPCLTRFLTEHYGENKRDPRGGLYSHSILFSPAVPFFREDDGDLREEPVLCAVLTVPAVNAGIVAEGSTALVQETMRERLRRTLAIAAGQGVRTLVLGAWGCGVFKNDPAEVASVFREWLVESDAFQGHFDEAIFAIPDPEMLHTFTEAIGGQEALAQVVEAYGLAEPSRREKGAGKGKGKRWKGRRGEVRTSFEGAGG